MTVAARSRAPTSSGTHGERRARSAGAPRSRGRHRLAHRPVGLGQVDRRRRASSGCWSRRAGPPTCSTATTCATASTATSASPPPTATENVRRVGEVARLFADAGVVALVPLISPYRAGRDRARAAARGGRAAVRRGVRRHARSRCASAATRRASTPRPGRARSPVHRHRRPLRGARRTPSSSSPRPTATRRAQAACGPGRVDWRSTPRDGPGRSGAEAPDVALGVAGASSRHRTPGR